MTEPRAIPAVFLDRDGTIIEDRGHLRDRSQVVFLPETFDALRRLQEEFLLFIITNQPGIARRTITREDADTVNAYVVARLADEGIRIADIYVCPHTRQDGCPCIKPKGYFLHQAARRYGVELRRSFTIGDHPHDVELGRAAGGRGIYVLTGHGRKHLAELAPDATATRNIGQAAGRVLQTACDARHISRTPKH
jgi:histidinol-phosphate phosphatase family protein